jgi:hypothetical protein
VKSEAYDITSNFGSITVTYPTLRGALADGASNFDSSLHATADVVSVKEGTPTLGNVYVRRVSLISLLVYFMRSVISLPAALSATLVPEQAAWRSPASSPSAVSRSPRSSRSASSRDPLGLYPFDLPFSKEKELTHESRERDKTTLDFKAKMLLGATGKRRAIWSSIA